MPQPIPYLSFNGNCKEAMQFYEKALLGKLQAMLTFGQTPMAEHCVPADLNQICHACLVFEDGKLGIEAAEAAGMKTVWVPAELSAELSAG